MTTERQFTDREKRELENETNFIVYLHKTKQGKFIGNEFYVGKSEPYTKLTELDPEVRKIFYDKYEYEQILVLEFILYGQLINEVIDQMDANYYGNLTAVKTSLGVVKKKLRPVIERDFKTVYENGTKAENKDESNNLLKYLESWAKDVCTFRVPAKIVMSKMSKAFNYENDTMLATADRIIKKHER